MSLTLSRLGFFLGHCVVHLLFYIVPETLYNVFFRWPICLIEWMIGEENLTLSPWNERCIKAVKAPRDSTTYDLFGLSSCTHYEGPMYNGHVHTILGGLRPLHTVNYVRETVKAEDGNPLCIDYLSPPNSGEAAGANAKGLVLILPGLSGCSQAFYVGRVSTLLCREGFHVAVLNARGVGDTPLEKPRVFGAVYTEDLRYVLKTHFGPLKVQQRLKSKEPKPLIGLGFSLGGAVLCKYLGEQGVRKEATPLSAGIAFNSPFDLNAADNSVRNSFYTHVLVKDMIAYAKRHKSVLKRLPGINASLLFEGERPLLNQINTLFAFDTYLTAPYFGFGSAEEYYNAANCFVSLSTSQIPFLCVANRNDPICGAPATIRSWERLARSNPSVAYVEIPSGGHLGYLCNPFAELCQTKNEGERLILSCLQNFCKNISR